MVRCEEAYAFTLVIEGVWESEVPPAIIQALAFVPYWPTLTLIIWNIQCCGIAERHHECLVRKCRYTT